MTCSHKIKADVEIKEISKKVENRNFEHPFMPLSSYYKDRKILSKLNSYPESVLKGYEDGVWNCRNDEKSGSMCAYHSKEYTPDERVKKLYKDMEKNTEDPLVIVDSRFSSIDLSQVNINRPICIVNCVFDGDLYIDISTENMFIVSNSNLNGELILDEVDIDKNDLELSACLFEEQVTLSEDLICRNFILNGSIFRESFEIYDNIDIDSNFISDQTDFTSAVNFSSVDFCRRVSFDGAKFCSRAIFTKSVFYGETCFRDVKFNNQSIFRRSKFKEDASFYDTEFVGRARFMRSNFHNTCFERSNFKNWAEFDGSTFKGDAEFLGASFKIPDFEDTDFNKEANFRGADFISEAVFRNSNFYDAAIFGSTTFSNGVIFRNSDFYGEILGNKRTEIAGGNFTEAYINSGNLRRSDLRKCDFTDATIEDLNMDGVDLRGSSLKNTEFDTVRINRNTRILGNPNNKRRKGRGSVISYINAIPKRFKHKCQKCADDPFSEFNNGDNNGDIHKPTSDFSRYINGITGRNLREKRRIREKMDVAENVYYNIEQIAKESSRSKLFTESFIRRQDLKLRRYRSKILTPENHGILNIFALEKWIRTGTARLTMVYGESPWRILLISGIIIFLSGLIYQVLGLVDPNPNTPNTVENTTLIDTIYYSSLIYTSLGFASFNPIGMGRFLAAFEALSGIIMLALLVFALGRRASR